MPGKIAKSSTGFLCLALSYTIFLSACSDNYHDRRQMSDTALKVESLPDARQVLPPPPLPGSAAQADDDRLFKITRDLKGSERWALAQHDAKLDKSTLVEDYSCAVGYKLDLKQLPHLAAVLQKVSSAVSQRTSEAKHYWHRRRPFVGTSLPTCTSVDDLGPYSSFPSGHTTAGYGVALILASLLPEKASSILERGRVFGESRIVCGVHWKSDVQAGYLNAASQMNAVLRAPSLQKDLKQAQKELHAAQKVQPPPDEAQCRVEHDATMHSLLSQF